MDQIRTWFFDAVASHVAAVFEAMAGARPGVHWEASSAPPESAGLMWRQGFHGASGAVWILASPQAWTEAGNQILRAAGIGDGDETTVKSTYLETLGQALGGVAQELSARLGREVTPSGGEESPSRPGAAAWAKIHLQFENGALEIEAGAETALIGSLMLEEHAPAAMALAAEAAGGSKTFELLLDVELPVSVSFGRAQVPLKDVIKLTTGSIVELNRSIAEPVEVIVNNCVIARGEVVVVEGNFGVRIREVISQKERLRTLN